MKKRFHPKTHTKLIEVIMHTCRGFPWASREAHLSSRLCVVVYGRAGGLVGRVAKSAPICCSRRLQGSWSSLAHLCSAYVPWYGTRVQWVRVARAMGDTKDVCAKLSLALSELATRK